MKTKNMTQEQISAFADGELSDAQLDMALATLRESDGRAKWDVYHQIGEVLRSDDMAFEMSPEFTARLSARLDDEPTIMAPPVHQYQEQVVSSSETSAQPSAKRFWLRGMAAAAAVAATAFVATPHLMVASKGSPASEAVTTMLASASQSPKARIIAQQEGEILRDPGIDEYLLAHQRFSPSLYSTAQYARSATFAIDSDK